MEDHPGTRRTTTLERPHPGLPWYGDNYVTGNRKNIRTGAGMEEATTTRARRSQVRSRSICKVDKVSDKLRVINSYP